MLNDGLLACQEESDPLSWPEIPQAPCSRRLLPLADENLCLGTQNPEDNAHSRGISRF